MSECSWYHCCFPYRSVAYSGDCHFDLLSLLNKITAIVSRNFYQRNRSNVKFICKFEYKKGYSCAYRLLHGGESCSDYVKHLLGEQSLMSAVKISLQRFKACSAASHSLRATRANRSFMIGIIPCCPVMVSSSNVSDSSILSLCKISANRTLTGGYHGSLED